MLFPVVQVNDTLKESFKEFQQNLLNNFKVNVRRTRAVQLRQLLSNPEAIDLQTFQDEVWNIENKTHLQSSNIDLRIFEAPTMFAPNVEQLLNQEKVTLPELEIALVSGDLELHGNYVWLQGAHLYAHGIKDEQQKLINIHTALQILNNPFLNPIEKAQKIDV